jgi:hypothetical protein
MMDTPSFDPKGLVRPALKSIALYLSVFVISVMAMVKPAYAIGSVPQTSYTVSYVHGGLPNFSISCLNYSSEAEVLSCYYSQWNAKNPTQQLCSFPTMLVNAVTIGGILYSPGNEYYNVFKWAPSFGGCQPGYLEIIQLVYTNICPENSRGPTPGHGSATSTCACLPGYQPESTGTSCVPVYNCPAHASGNPCVCDPGFVPNGTLCDPEIFSITLSGGTATEPWHKKWDQNHTSSNSNLSFNALVKNQNGQPKENVNVYISSDVTPGSGGHAHDNNRPKGWLAETPAKITAQIQAGASQGSGILSGATDSSGAFAFTFGAEEASGEHRLTATCMGCSIPATSTVDVTIPDLMLLGVEPTSYDLQGYTDWHPGNHYFSESAIVKIINLAHAYRLDPTFNNQLLIINDSSLVKGGVFDLGQDWTYKPNGHQGHRKGTVVDINNYRNGPSPQFKRFASFFGITAKWEGPDVTATPHYHLWLLGEDE